MRRLAGLVMVTAACLLSVSPARADALSVKQVSITAPVYPGAAVTLIVQTRPGATCDGMRQGHFGNAYSIKLAGQTASRDGLVQWQWSVLNGNRPIGVRGVRVTCSAGNESGSLETAFDVE